MPTGSPIPDKWTCDCVGTVIASEFESIDKTGQKRFGNILLTVEPDSVSFSYDVLEATEPLLFALRRAKLKQLIFTAPEVGDRIRIRGDGTGRRPRRMLITAIERLADTLATSPPSADTEEE